MGEGATRPGEAALWKLVPLLNSIVGDVRGTPDVSATSRSVVEAAVSDLAGAEHASVVVVGEKWPVAASSRLASELDDAQHALNEGPCVDALRERAVHTGDLTRETRWPGFAAFAAGRRIRSAHVVQLFVTGSVRGTLNLYSSQVGSFTADEEKHTHLFASHAAIAIAAARHKAQMLQAIEMRDTIGMAKGILMERDDLGPSEAFQLLVRTSQRSNMRLRTLSSWIVANRRAL
ncbi:GAF and ANTAR domain-containing protein [Lentzea sp. HUAS12]|uniref:GAF and ANTAR domain-containing protein n=1 Tax=Lentzea sp. HUAS12 TaxID=2951806 RepID=UPI00209FF511|nr:GAF and ANTAR domain-containing protein [Lentzea sp. HUAS12]USX54429.1 GAF and ANTAR domain-containing protein [Lentzea sp. HUAS12]